ncbi:MAG: hypothetical protein ABH826_04430 [Patescibacteria group bacterium]|nr:hypothetical protein [Patescibacteria group bacterium]
MTKKKNKLSLVYKFVPYILITITLITGTILFINYTNAIKERTEVERLRVETEEDLELKKLEQEQIQIEQETHQAEEDAEAVLIAQYRQECLAVQEENEDNFERFINSCTINNTIDWCLDSEAGQLFMDDFTPTWIEECIEFRMNSGQ